MVCTSRQKGQAMHIDVKSALGRVGACIATLVLAVSLTPAVAHADQVQGDTFELRPVGGYIPLDKEINEVAGSSDTSFRKTREAYPEKYRSDQQPWAAGIRVKDQESTPICWAFCVTTVAEYSFAKESYEQRGTVSEVSPAHLAYFLFNRVVDPLGNTAGDSNLCIDSDGWPITGGSQWQAMQHLATYSGMGLEANTRFEQLTEHIVYDKDSKKNVWVGSQQVYDDAYAYDDYITQQECIMSTLRGENLAEDVSKIKQLVSTYGAVAAGMECDKIRFFEEELQAGKNFESGHSFYNFTGSCRPNHAVTIIGWDDSYAASNFSHAHNVYGQALTIQGKSGETIELTEEEALEMTTPPGDGAWIVQNSWGAGCHENGCFYMSYYCPEVRGADFLYAFDMQPADTYEYNFQYDGNTAPFDATDTGNEAFRTMSGTSAANVYTNTTDGPITIDGVGFTVWTQGEVGYEVSVYTALTDADDPTSGLLAGTTSATTTSAGSKTVALSEPVTIGAGERFAIVFDFLADDTGFGVEQGFVNAYYGFVAQLDPGQSFFRGADSDTWEDMYQYDSCFRIKGLGNSLDPARATYTVEFVDGQGKVLDTQKVAHGKAAKAPCVSPRKGYLFSGWSCDFSHVTSNLVVSATWKSVPDWCVTPRPIVTPTWQPNFVMRSYNYMWLEAVHMQRCLKSLFRLCR